LNHDLSISQNDFDSNDDHSTSREDENRSLNRVKQIISREFRQTSCRKRQSSRRVLLTISKRHRVVVRKARDQINSLIVEKTEKEKNNNDESKIELRKKRKLISIVLKFILKSMLKTFSRFQRRIIEIEIEIDIETSLSCRSLRKISIKTIIQLAKKLINNLEFRNDLKMKNVENSSQNKNKKSALRDSSRKNDASSKH
jgi:hypothetical protein